MSVASRNCPTCGAAVAARLRMCLTCGLPLQPAPDTALISQVPGAAGWAPGGALELVFDTGQRLRVSGPSLIGRHPSSPSHRCLAVEDPARSVSKVHLEVGLDAQGLWVMDRHSTNGSTLTRAGQAPSRLVGGQPVHLGPGDTVSFGRRHFRVAVVAP
jgi:predicted component of type VI protein secretion system